MTEIQILREKVRQIEYPESVIKMVNGEINGVGFFPGASGLIGASKRISDREFMILGQDQDNVKGFEKSKDKGKEDYSPTWKNLKDILDRANINLENCFFTNCILGIRKEDSNTGKSPAIRETFFLKECLNFLEFQIDLQRPKAIICLGLVPIKLMGHISKELNLKFMEIEGFKKVDENEISVNKLIEFENIRNFKTTVIVLTHPSYRRRNSKIRKFGKFSEDDAEIEMLKEVKR